MTSLLTLEIIVAVQACIRGEEHINSIISSCSLDYESPLGACSFMWHPCNAKQSGKS